MISADIFIPFLRELSNKNLRFAAEIEGIHYANFNVKEKWSYIDNFIVTDYLNISGSADKLYFGDDINDKEMLLNVGLGVAMSNSIDEIKMTADYICDTNDNDGVAKWLDENIIKMKYTYIHVEE